MRCDLTKEPKLKTRASKALGATAGIAAIVASVPFAINAYADPPADPATPSTPVSTPVAPIPDPQGSGCDAFKAALPNWKDLATQPVSKVLGKGGDIKVNDTAKVVCGGIQAENARIYIIDQVLDTATAPEPIVPTGTSATTTTSTSTQAPPSPAAG